MVRGKVNKIQRKGYTSYIFMIVNYYRDGSKPYGQHKIKYNFGSVRSYNLSKAEHSVRFYSRVETVLAALIASESIEIQAADRVREKFREYFPMQSQRALPISRKALGVSEANPQAYKLAVLKDFGLLK
jgi:hypothetical protein